MEKEKGSNRKFQTRKTLGSSKQKSKQEKYNDGNGRFLLLAIMTGIGCNYLGKSDYEKGINYLKDKKFTEALYKFQKVDPDNKNFSNAGNYFCAKDLKKNYIFGMRSNFNPLVYGIIIHRYVFLYQINSNEDFP